MFGVKILQNSRFLGIVEQKHSKTMCFWHVYFPNPNPEQQHTKTTCFSHACFQNPVNLTVLGRFGTKAFEKHMFFQTFPFKTVKQFPAGGRSHACTRVLRKLAGGATTPTQPLSCTPCGRSGGKTSSWASSSTLGLWLQSFWREVSGQTNFRARACTKCRSWVFNRAPDCPGLPGFPDVPACVCVSFAFLHQLDA